MLPDEMTPTRMLRRPTRRPWAVPLRAAPVAGGLVLILAVGLVSVVAWWMQDHPQPVSWSRLDSPDAHSITFEGASTEVLYFGSHAGVHRSVDGGRSWRPLDLAADAMTIGVVGAGSIIVAGHDVLVISNDGGASWADLSNDLPDLDIHGFARDPGDPLRMWVFLAGGTVHESLDGGRRWTQVLTGTRPFLTASSAPGGTVLLAVDPGTGVARSADGGRTWAPISDPGAYPITALASGPDADLIVVGTSGALIVSNDGGKSWRRSDFPGTPLAAAVARDGKTVVIVADDRRIYRSTDGGRTWPGPAEV